MTKVGLISDEGPVNAHVGSVSSNLAQSTGKTLRLKKKYKPQAELINPFRTLAVNRRDLRLRTSPRSSRSRILIRPLLCIPGIHRILIPIVDLLLQGHHA